MHRHTAFAGGRQCSVQRGGLLEQVVLEMVELREVDTARAMLRQTAVFTRMKQAEPDRFLRLEHLCGRTYFDIRCAPTRRARPPHSACTLLLGGTHLL